MSRIFTSEKDRRNKLTGKFVPHRACVEAIKEQQSELISFLQRERVRIAQLKSEVRDMDTAFRARSTRFRAVFDTAWSALLEQSPRNLTALRNALDRADHLWEGFGGVIPDPNPSAEKWKHNKLARTRNHSRYPVCESCGQPQQPNHECP